MATDGSSRSWPSKLLGGRREEREQARVLEHAGAERVDDRDRAPTAGLDQPGDPELRVGAQLERIAPLRVDPTQDHVDRIESSERTEVDPAVAHREIAALDDREPEVGPEVGVLERGLGLGAGAQHDDARIVGVRGVGEALEQCTQAAEVGRHPMDLAVPVEAGEHPRHHPPVRQCVSRPGRRLGPVGQHAQLPAGPTCQIRGVGEQLLLDRRRDSVALTQESGVAEDDLGGDDLSLQQLSWTVEIPLDQIEDDSALDDGFFDQRPLGTRYECRERVERPPGGDLVTADAVGDALVVEHLVEDLLAATELIEAEAVEHLGRVGPVFTATPVGMDHLVEDARLGSVVPEQRPREIQRHVRRAASVGRIDGPRARRTGRIGPVVSGGDRTSEDSDDGPVRDDRARRGRYGAVPHPNVGVRAIRSLVPNPSSTRRVSAHLEFNLGSSAAIALQIAAASSAGENLGERLDVSLDGAPGPSVVEFSTGTGGRGHVVEADAGVLRIDYSATIGAPHAPTPDDDDGGPLPLDDDTIIGLRQSRYCPSDTLLGFAAAEFDTTLDPHHLAAQVAGWVHQRFNYIPGSSDALDTAVDTLVKHEGVCRDFAHVTISLCRALGIPARLAAVYAPGITPMDFHAVVEVRTDRHWEVLDPTRLAPRPALVRIATGRDAADTAFATTLRGAVMLTMSEVTAVADPELPEDDHSGRVVLT